ncbi:thiamine phosphate synthase [Halalkalibacterium halodurans]|uniref:Thiamine-phosphate synthase n=1 Tax=Halalkalibacterium halodurans (strain ATCC BAA-125 / DSM 18197 / FERM 7344 / JCM 9153 / C-125) TaxID=272558 RepID=THIE_HALH5|nr:thiamine phosphate synthase [Halalkalibacterium halodurans]Q9KCY8.1 RecName: Full=Thiamine-phosphate synthase; Short=TP synthase; Short=TPS; AltName: Full=Thiamine-phosphate pyrophosphorylase; Short=TMP pyrophosphorylase; Short=TMP-PPase [Halalkalibacterium halodurans C-125]MDY7221954.1 thiamine phosphate synthase [Halalkalibacterium halodurans]MDY7241230.1 thiamine phosphate synthase [Halalkalibacterium halodurans]MED4124626.1 thiamine phosphate synthase [Halalkalibacterium halodurans]MED4
MRDFRLYAITGEEFHPDRSLQAVMEEAILGGVDIIQLRDKKSHKREVLEKARVLQALAKKYDIPLIINDHIDVALAVDADGIHLGQDDLPLSEARKIMGRDKIIGISTHKIEEAREAEKGGADYIGVGPIFETKSKEDVVDPVTTAYIQQVAHEISIPFVAIGGIKLHNVEQVLDAGATRICMISEIVGAEDVKGTCEVFSTILEQRGIGS